MIADALVINAEGVSAVRDVFLNECLAVEDTTYIISKVGDDCVDSHVFHPYYVLLYNQRIGAVIAATYFFRLHVRRLQKRNRDAVPPKGDGRGAPPGPLPPTTTSRF